MITDMRFIYALSYQGNVFYIGNTKDMIARYKRHLSGCECLNVSLYIKSIIAAGDVPIMKPVCYLPYIDAIKKESEVIRLFTKAGHRLLNDLHTYISFWAHEQLPSIIDKINMLKYLDEYQKQYEQTTIN